MLVLSRSSGESLIITIPPCGDATLIEISVEHIGGNKVKLGAIAPQRVTVNRKEIHQRMLTEASGMEKE